MTWSSRLGVRREASNLILENFLKLRNPKEMEKAHFYGYDLANEKWTMILNLVHGTFYLSIDPELYRCSKNS